MPLLSGTCGAHKHPQISTRKFKLQRSCMQVFWMNHALRTLWPYYNKAIGKMVLEQAKPMIEEQIKPVRLLA